MELADADSEAPLSHHLQVLVRGLRLAALPLDDGDPRDADPASQSILGHRWGTVALAPPHYLFADGHVVT